MFAGRAPAAVPAEGPTPVPPPITVDVLSSHTGEAVDWGADRNRIVATGPGDNTDGNIREVFAFAGVPESVDHQTCAVWEDTAESSGSPRGNRQMGLALRVAPVRAGAGVKAITLTQNVYAGATWKFWVDVWWVEDPTDPEFHGVASFDLLRTVGTGATAVPPPWHVCARVRGDVFSFKLWTGSEPEPRWSDPARVFSTRLPPGWVYAGRPGGYLGHLGAGETAAFSDLRTRSRPSPTPPAAPGVGHRARPATPVLGRPGYVG